MRRRTAHMADLDKLLDELLRFLESEYRNLLHEHMMEDELIELEMVAMLREWRAQFKEILQRALPRQEGDKPTVEGLVNQLNLLGRNRDVI